MRYYREVELEHIRKDARLLRLNATDIKDAMMDIEMYLAQLKNIAVEVSGLPPGGTVCNITTSALQIILYVKG